jgi:hypothetical protein
VVKLGPEHAPWCSGLAAQEGEAISAKKGLDMTMIVRADSGAKLIWENGTF